MLECSFSRSGPRTPARDCRKSLIDDLRQLGILGVDGFVEQQIDFDHGLVSRIKS